jgi:hypothetical protein
MHIHTTKLKLLHEFRATLHIQIVNIGTVSFSDGSEIFSSKNISYRAHCFVQILLEKYYIFLKHYYENVTTYY